MRTHFILIILLLSVTTIQAQITITSNDAPSVGMTLYQANDSTPSLSVLPGNAGANQTWNLSAANFMYYDTMQFILPSATPYASQFSGSNLATKFWLNGSPAYYFINKDNSGVYGTGANGNLNLTLNQVITVHFIPLMTMLRTPTTYQSSYTENYHYSVQSLPPANLASYADSIKSHSWVTGSSIIDGWGTITTPGGTFDVLRQFLREISTDTIWVKVPLFGWQQYATGKDTADTYKWWANSIGVSVAEMKMNRAQNKAKSVIWYVPTPTEISQLSANSTICVYPNPSSDYIQVNNMKRDLEYAVKIYDLTGKEIKSLQLRNVINQKISLEEFKSGIYFISVLQNNNKIKTEKVIISR